MNICHFSVSSLNPLKLGGALRPSSFITCRSVFDGPSLCSPSMVLSTNKYISFFESLVGLAPISIQIVGKSDFPKSVKLRGKDLSQMEHLRVLREDLTHLNLPVHDVFQVVLFSQTMQELLLLFHHFVLFFDVEFIVKHGDFFRQVLERHIHAIDIHRLNTPLDCDSVDVSEVFLSLRSHYVS